MPPYSALSIFRHARAVIWHTQQCRPELLGSQLLLSHAYTGLYGAAIAALHATTREKGKWREQAVLPTEAQRKAFEALLARAVALPVDEVLPAELQPGLREGVRDAWRGYDTEQEKAGGIERMNMVRTVSGEQFCKLDKNRHWVYYKITKKEVRYSKVDCCSPACLGFPHLTGFSGGAFTANCCLRCNWERCAGKMTVASRAVFELGEVQMPGASSPSLGRRQRILVLL